MTKHQKVNELIFSEVYANIYFKKAVLRRRNSSLTFSCLLLSSSFLPPKKFYLHQSLLYHSSTFFLLEHLFCLSHRKTRWIMSIANVGLKICLLGTSNSTITLTFFPWCKPKWSQDEFNSQSQILQGMGQLHGPWCKHPMMSVIPKPNYIILFMLGFTISRWCTCPHQPMSPCVFTATRELL